MAMLGVAAAAPVVANDFEAEDFEGGFLSDGFFVVGNDGFLDDGFEEFEQEDIESGDVAPVVDISNSGDNTNLASTVSQSANSGNVQNEQGVTQFNSPSDDIEFEASSIGISPSVESDTTQTIQQFAGDGFFDDGSVVGPFAQEFEQENVASGDVAPVVDISNSGDHTNLAPTVSQSANSGNVQNQQGAVLSGSEVDDVEFEGSSIEIASELESDTTQTIQQSAGASR